MTQNPPTQVTRDNFQSWLSSINPNSISAFFDEVFDWYNQQLSSPPPSQINSDPDKIYVDVNSAEQQTINFENTGDVPAGTTMGYDAYCQFNVPISVALQTILFFCGKPIDKDEGGTYPFNDVFSDCHCSMNEKWGPDNYLSTVSMTGGGVVDSLHDYYAILIRGDAAGSYSIFSSFLGPVLSDKPVITTTTAQISFAILKSLSDNVTEVRQSFRRNGQSYAQFGLDFGRQEYGFNASTFHQQLKELRDSMVELMTTGTIKQNSPS